MVDDKYKNADDGDDEFEFGEIEHTRDDQDEEFKGDEFVVPSRTNDIAASAGSGESSLFRNFIIGGVTLVLIFAAYKLFGVYSSEKAKPVATIEKSSSTEKLANFDDFLKSKPSTASKPAEPSLFEVKKSTAAEPLPIDLKAKPEVTPVKLETAKTETPVAESIKAELLVPKPVKPEPAKPVAVKVETAKSEVSKSEAVKPEVVKPAVAKSEVVKAEPTHAKKETHTVKEVVHDTESVKQVESEVSKLNRTIERLEQRVTDLDEKLREEKMHHDKTMHEALITSSMAETHHKRPAPVVTSPSPHRNNMIQHSKPVASKQMPVADCYAVDSLSRHAAIIIRLDNQTQMTVSRGSQLPFLIQVDGRCVAKPGETVEVTTLDGETGSLRIGGGLSLIAPTELAVEAVISGRAWLKDSNGSTITVEEGTIIPGYGRVTKIDVTEGIVRTSSGRMIQHRIDER